MTEFRYTAMNCRFCGGLITPEAEVVARPPTATSYQACLFKCSACNVGYSNGKAESARTAIWLQPQKNVPRSYRRDLMTTLAASVNLTNQENKTSKLGYSTSEDAVTWTIFRWLEMRSALSLVLMAAGAAAPDGAPEVLWWAAPRRGVASPLSVQLAEICLALKEHPRGFTEPDLVASWPDQHLCFVEVKYQAPNESKPGYANFDTYTSGADAELFLDPEEAKEQGWYELSRNWVIGSRLAAANGQDFTLINLAPAMRKLSAEAFAKAIVSTPRREFHFLSWKDFLGQARADKVKMPPSIQQFIADRGLENRWG